MHDLTIIVEDQTSQQHTIFRKFEAHEIKLIASGTSSISDPFQLVTDTELYPTLISAINKYTHFSNLPKMLQISIYQMTASHDSNIFMIV